MFMWHSSLSASSWGQGNWVPWLASMKSSPGRSFVMLSSRCIRCDVVENLDTFWSFPSDRNDWMGAILETSLQKTWYGYQYKVLFWHLKTKFWGSHCDGSFWAFLAVCIQRGHSQDAIGRTGCGPTAPVAQKTCTCCTFFRFANFDGFVLKTYCNESLVFVCMLLNHNLNTNHWGGEPHIFSDP